MGKVVKKKMTMDDLAVMVANGFSGVENRFNKVENCLDKVMVDVSELKTDVTGLKKDMVEVKENVKNTRADILNLGDRFVSYHTFDALAGRVKVLEEKKLEKTK